MAEFKFCVTCVYAEHILLLMDVQCDRRSRRKLISCDNGMSDHYKHFVDADHCCDYYKYRPENVPASFRP